MLDHLLVDLIAQVQDAFDRAFLERLAVEERFQVDVFLGDVSWETSYSLPGEEQPPRVQADLAVDWPTWSQTAYRSWTLGETPAEMPDIPHETLAATIREARATPPETIGPGYYALMRLDEFVASRIVEAAVHGIDLDTAFDRLRKYARSHGADIHDVSQAVTNRQLLL